MIRCLTPEDYESFFSLRLSALTNCPVDYATTAKSWSEAPKEKILAMLKGSQSRDNGLILGSFIGQELVGVIGVKRDARATVRHNSTLWGLYVAEQARRRGHATGLVEKLISDVSEQLEGVIQMRCMVTSTNEAALCLFEKLGFSEFGREERAMCINGRFYTRCYLCLHLDS